MNVPHVTDSPAAPLAVGLHGLVGRLKAASPQEFVTLVRQCRKAGDFLKVCDMVNARTGAGVSQSRMIGNLCEAIHGKEKRNLYVVAFYEPSNDQAER